MNLTECVDRTLDVVNLRDGDPYFLPCITLRGEVKSGYLLPSRIAVNRDLRDVSGIAFNGGHFENVEVKRRCLMRTGLVPNGPHFVRVLCVEAAGDRVAQGFWDLVGCNETVRIGKDSQLLEDSR